MDKGAEANAQLEFHFNSDVIVVFLSSQKSRQSAYENEEDISVRNNNNSGRSADTAPATTRLNAC